MTRRRRILVHAQHLSGVGHHVRGLEIARAAARDCDVYFASGGREVARPASAGCVEWVRLPEIARGGGGLEALHGGPPAAALAARAAALAEAAAEIAPDVLLVEHYPFSKWELEPELSAAIEAAQLANPAVAVVCSVRDAPRQTRHEDVPSDAWCERVVGTLNERFDALLVHADPAFTTLGEHLAGAAAIRIPVFHTGFVSEKAPRDGPTPQALAAAAAEGQGLVAVSCGGGAGSAGFAERVLDAWSRLAARGATGHRRLAVFTGAFWSDAESARIGRAAAAQGALSLAFRDDFLRWLGRCDLSISRAGYNTCTNVLELRIRALLVPDPHMSDQAFRAGRMAERGLARLAAESAEGEALGEAIAEALWSEPPVHDLDLEGASRTSELLAGVGPARSGRS